MFFLPASSVLSVTYPAPPALYWLSERLEGNVSGIEKDERVAALRRWRRAWPLAGLALAAVVNVLWVGVLGYALIRLL
jgi:hypothetical protein